MNDPIFATATRRPGVMLAGALLAGWCAAAQAAPPVVTTVPAQVNVPTSRHDIISGRPTTLKGAVDEASIGSTWTWDFGDGTGTCSGNVDANPTSIFQLDDGGFNPYWALWCEHTYTGTPGDIFIATLTVDNGVDAPSSAQYRMEVRPNVISSEVNAAIDEALWHMHRNQFRFDGNETGGNGTIPMGRWDFPQTSGQVRLSVTGAVVNAFEANGYLENGPASSPYSNTVARGLKYIFARLRTDTGVQTLQAGEDADTNGNGLGVTVNEGEVNYQSGMFMDAVIASGTPGAVATTGPAGIIGRTYGDIVQDMVDYYAWSQNDSGAEIGGWIYNPSNNSGQSTDNSTAGWVAIGIAAAEDVFGSTVPQWVKDRNEIALEATDNESDTSDRDGIIGYQSSSEIWGPYSTTGAGMIQMSMDGILSTSSATPDERWIRSENFFRRHYNDAASGNNLKNYYYAMFNLAKALRTAKPGPVVVIGANDSVGCGPSPSCAGGVAPLDWYNDPSVGMARVVVDYQVTTGVNIGGFTDRPGNSHGSNQDDHNTPWATQILTRTLFQPGPTAVATATPNPAASGTPIEFDGTASFHDDPDRSIVQWDWDFDEDGVTDASGPVVVNAFPCPNLPCVYPVTLTVTDDNDVPLTAQAIVEVEITIPPHPPTADAGGPYLVCTGEDLNLDGSGSFDIDEGLSETGDPPFDTITAWDWELDGVSPFDFDEATGETVVYVTNDPFSGLIGLQVTDNTAAAFPTSGQPDLTGRDFTTLNVVECGCLQNFFARGKADTNGAAVNLVWPPVDDATSYDVFRSTEGPNTGFQLLKAGHVTTRATYFDKIAPPLAANYWYRVAVNGVEGCGGSVAAQASIGNRTLPRR